MTVLLATRPKKKKEKKKIKRNHNIGLIVREVAGLIKEKRSYLPEEQQNQANMHQQKLGERVDWI